MCLKCGPLIKAIDAYIEKADGGLSDALKEEGYTKAKKTVKYIEDMEDGVSEAFRKQQEENEQGWGLVLAMPKEVEEASQYLGHEQFQSRAQKHLQGSEYYRGFEEGTEFDPTKRLGEEATV